MFDFERLEVYKMSKLYYLEISKIIESKKELNFATINQLSRSSLSIVLNIAEGSGRFSNADKRRFYIISRGSVFETVSIADVLTDKGVLSSADFQKIHNDAEIISKKLWHLIKRLEAPPRL
jgi:four helix bundle protein